MKILITGGSGFIGSHIVDQLSKDKKNELIIFDIVRPDFEISENENPWKLFFSDTQVILKSIKFKNKAFGDYRNHK